MKIKINSLFPAYSLLDCGNAKKLERFNDVILIRPELSASKPQVLNYEDWKKIANAEFIESTKNRGSWNIFKQLPSNWNISYNSSRIRINAELSLSESKHIGIFPEQVLNWNFIERIAPQTSCFEFLNLFAYTGLSSVCAAHFFDKVVHLDSIKKNVNQARRNAEISGLTNVSCIVEDARKYVARCEKRNSKFDGIILDPPAIGVGANSEKWIFEKNIDELLLGVARITAEKSFLIMNLYSNSINEKYVHKLILTYFKGFNIDFCQKIFGVSETGNTIDHGYFIRLIKKAD